MSLLLVQHSCNLSFGVPILCASYQHWEREGFLSAIFAKLDYVSLELQKTIFPGSMKKELCVQQEEKQHKQGKGSDVEPEGALRLCETLIQLCLNPISRLYFPVIDVNEFPIFFVCLNSVFTTLTML